MEDISAAIIALLEREGISQRTLASRAGVSQATVSRAVKNRPLRPGRARARLLTYLRANDVMTDADPIFSAVGEIWDGSSAHAAALAHLLRASQELWPKLKESES